MLTFLVSYLKEHKSIPTMLKDRSVKNLQDKNIGIKIKSLFFFKLWNGEGARQSNLENIWKKW